MLLLFYTRERKICEEICSRLKDYKHLAFVYTDFKDFNDAIHDLGPEKIDLLCVDYRLSEYEYSKPFESLIAQNFIVPFIFYNSPYALYGERAAYWSYLNKKKFGDLLHAKVSDKMVFLLSQLETIIDSPDILPYISLICPPKDFISKEESAIQKFDLEDFRFKHKIQNSKYKLFSYFFKNREKVISAKELCLYMWGQYSEQKLESLYSYISILRKIISKESTCLMDIERVGRECYIFKISVPALKSKDEKSAVDFFTFTQKSTRSNFTFSKVSRGYLREHQRYFPLEDSEM